MCEDFEPCEECYHGVDDADMPSGHSKEHLMTAVEGIPNPNQRLMELSFAKPVSPQWAYRVDDMGVPLFRWSQRQHLANTLMKTVKDFEALQRDALPTATTSKEELSDSVVWTEVQYFTILCFLYSCQ